ncbi:LUD domain-containing protein [Candidatus Albibeggiatoa sp. nov. NOAA]|uniref:LutC/YkgG family protein n=1 Tax=Candidatus Albibeggiatoa sp. nov. NOAA TaxID=3162724 RepID=UPI003303BD3F|nr:LUD domain-containing protein [Thiotrichaceae bacterium]
MDTSRDIILGNIRQSLKRYVLDVTTEQSLSYGLKHPTQHIRPDWEQDNLQRFIQQLESVVGTYEYIDSIADFPNAVLRFLEQHQLRLEILCDAQLKVLCPWPSELTLQHRAAQAGDSTSVSYAFAGVAETGSIAMLSSENNPTSFNFLPDNHIVLLEQKNIVSHMEDVWTTLRHQARTPRTINIITGPSRTADIEQTIQLGAHGPRHLHVVIV